MHDAAERGLLELMARVARLELQVEELSAMVGLLHRDAGRTP